MNIGYLIAIVILILSLVWISLVALPASPIHEISLREIPATCGISYTCNNSTCKVASPETCIFYVIQGETYTRYVGHSLDTTCRNCIIVTLCSGCSLVINRGNPNIANLCVSPLGVYYCKSTPTISPSCRGTLCTVSNLQELPQCGNVKIVWSSGEKLICIREG